MFSNVSVIHFGVLNVDLEAVYKWAYEVGKVLHRDISINNIMFREEGNKISGVLNDYDMAVDSSRTEGGTGHQRTGTKPFLAAELHLPIPLTHSYRHDLESLTYCLLWVLAKRQQRWGVDNKGKQYFYLTHPLSHWETASHESLGDIKFALTANRMPVSYSAFEGLEIKLTLMIEEIVNANNTNERVRRGSIPLKSHFERSDASKSFLERAVKSRSAVSQQASIFLQFSDYSRCLYDSDMEDFVKLVESASFDLNLAVLFKVD